MSGPPGDGMPGAGRPEGRGRVRDVAAGQVRAALTRRVRKVIATKLAALGAPALLALAAVGLIVVVLVVLLGAFIVLRAAAAPQPTPAGCVTTLDADGSDPSVSPAAAGEGVGGLSQRQLDHAATIIAVGKQLDVAPRGQQVALVTAKQEANLQVYANATVPESMLHDYEAVGHDHDSVGLFQQRPSWGTVAERMDPATSARLFYEALLAVPGWQQMPVTVAAQTVQRSAYPDAYAQWEQLAAQLVATLGDAPVDLGCDPAAAAAPGSWVRPATGTFTSGFGPRNGTMHEGVDIAAPIGVPIGAAADGVVIAVGPASGYGLWVRLDHGGGVVTEYGHVDTYQVRVGQRVAAGDQIATVGNRGRSTGPHLHFEIQVDGTAVDPIAFYDDRGLGLVSSDAGR